MKHFGLLFVSLLALAVGTAPLVAQDFPGAGDDPNPYVDKVSKSANPCEETLTAHACKKAEELKARASKNLEAARGWFEAADGAAEIGNDVGTVIESGAAIIEMGCTGEPSLDPITGPLQMIIAKAAEGYSEGKGYQYLAAADSCLAASKAWASLCRACCRRSQRPVASTVIEKNPDIDFNEKLDKDRLRRLLDELDQDERRATFEGAQSGTLICHPETRDAIKSMIKPTVLQTAGGGHFVDSFFDVHYEIDFRSR